MTQNDFTLFCNKCSRKTEFYHVRSNPESYGDVEISIDNDSSNEEHHYLKLKCSCGYEITIKI